MTLQSQFRYFLFFGLFLRGGGIPTFGPVFTEASLVKVTWNKILSSIIPYFLFERGHSIVAMKKIETNSSTIFCITQHFVSENFLFQAF